MVVLRATAVRVSALAAVASNSAIFAVNSAVYDANTAASLSNCSGPGRSPGSGMVKTYRHWGDTGCGLQVLASVRRLPDGLGLYLTAAGLSVCQGWMITAGPAPAGGWARWS